MNKHIVYRYIDLYDGIIKYVGITKRGLKQRVEEHKKLDKWVSESKWKIEYFYVNSKSESEAWESHLIALYETYNWYNKAKDDWGFIEIFRYITPTWILYELDDVIVDFDYNNLSEVDITGDNNLITELDIMLDLDLPKEEILIMVAKKVIQPLARTKNNKLVFWHNDIKKVIEYQKYFGS